MAKPKKPNQNDVLRLGQQVATVKANMPAKRWKRFVKMAHKRGYTVGAALSNRPDALKERTSSSLRDEARKTIATAYAPAQKALSTRESAIRNLDEKRKNDDAAYRTWLTGEVDKIHAQGRAADATLTEQQSTIAKETEDAIAAARADSLARMGAVPGTVSDPKQSTALDTSAADEMATKHVSAAREQTAGILKIGEDARSIASAAVLAQHAAREATRQGDTWKAVADLANDRQKLALEESSATAERFSALTDRNTQIAQSNEESDLAAASLGIKEDEIAASIAEANRKYKLETAKFGLEKWKANNKAKVDQAKIDLDYDKIAAQDGRAAVDRRLRERLEDIRSRDRKAARDQKNKTAEDKKKGVSKDERELFNDIEKARKLFIRWDKNNAVPLKEREQKLREMGASQGVIDVAHSLARNDGMMTDAARALARKLGVRHTGYFWPRPKTDHDDRVRG